MLLVNLSFVQENKSQDQICQTKKSDLVGKTQTNFQAMTVINLISAKRSTKFEVLF
jgi:hypothetical protein